MKKLRFEDHGQDFLWWTIDADGLVVDCGPFQASIWVGTKVIFPDSVQVGYHVDFVAKQGDVLQLKYKIEAIEEL